MALNGKQLLLAAMAIFLMVVAVNVRSFLAATSARSAAAGGGGGHAHTDAEVLAMLEKLKRGSAPAGPRETSAVGGDADAPVAVVDPELADLMSEVQSHLRNRNKNDDPSPRRGGDDRGRQEPPPRTLPDPDPPSQRPPVSAPAPAPAPAPVAAAAAAATTSSSTTKPQDYLTHIKCFKSVDWAEVCVYDNICFDGDKVVLFDDSVADKTSVERYHHVGDNTVGYHVFDVYPRPPKPSKGLPLNTRAKGYYRSSNVLKGKTSTKITWLKDESFWVVDPEYRGWEVQHPFFWAHSIFGLWEARYSNASWGGVMPPVDRVYLPVDQGLELGGWNTGTMDLVFPPGTKILTQDDTKRAGIGPDNLVCARRGGVTGAKPNVFSGIASCYAFRQLAYDKFKLTNADRHHWGPGKPPEEKYPPHHLVIRSRKDRRGFVNEDQMIALVESYKIPYTRVTSHGSFEDQVALHSKAGVLILAHGAAATNTMFQPHRSVLIEVFPFLRKRFGFMTVAQACGNFYYPIFSWERDPNDKKRAGVNSPLFHWKCDHRSSVDANYESACDQASKGGNIIVPLDVLEQTLIEAFDTIGKRIYKNGIRKPRPPMPPEGRKENLDTWTDLWLDE